jgi:hypothetical protein
MAALGNADVNMARLAGKRHPAGETARPSGNQPQ